MVAPPKLYSALRTLSLSSSLSSRTAGLNAAPGLGVQSEAQGTVTSADGTRLAYTRFGRGTPLVVCYGAYTVADDWADFARELGEQHTVYVYDRRGHGRSPYAGKPYTMTCEVEDLAAMMAVAGKDAALLGHSFGGGCALAYALRENFRGRVILYEPVHSVPRLLSRGYLPEFEKLVAAGDMAKATEFGLVNIARAPHGLMESFKQSPLWPAMMQQTPAFLNEVRFLDTTTWTPEQLRALPCRTWLLLGSLTQWDPSEVSTTASLVDRIPGVTLYPVMGQAHFAHQKNPAQLSRLVARCLSET